jgi:hypothetical protein
MLQIQNARDKPQEQRKVQTSFHPFRSKHSNIVHEIISICTTSQTSCKALFFICAGALSLFNEFLENKMLYAQVSILPQGNPFKVALIVEYSIGDPNGKPRFPRRGTRECKKEENMQGTSSCSDGPEPTGVQAMRLCVAQQYRDGRLKMKRVNLCHDHFKCVHRYSLCSDRASKNNKTVAASSRRTTLTAEKGLTTSHPHLNDRRPCARRCLWTCSSASRLAASFQPPAAAGASPVGAGASPVTMTVSVT